MKGAKVRRRVLVMGAGGRDFHNFNMLFRDDPRVEVVAFTAAGQVPFQQGRRYPASLAGPRYPDGIPIRAEADLPELIRRHRVEEVVFAYSDISHRDLMEQASRVLAMGSDFRLIGPDHTMLEASLPVISVCAVRTGCGKSPVTRYLCRLLLEADRKPVVVRHPMAYGRLDLRTAERFAVPADLENHQCTLEEREEFEPLMAMGVPLFAGVDYGRVLKRAEAEGDVLIWDGGNNDLAFFRPDLELVVADALRPGHEIGYYPGMVNLLRARVVVVNKVDQATEADRQALLNNIAHYRPEADLVLGRLDIRAENPEAIRGRKVVVVEDGPTLTHGGMAFGAGLVAARRFGAAAVIAPKPFASGSLAGVFAEHPQLREVVPAMGYSPEQVADLRATLEAVPCDLVVSATPVDLKRVLDLSRPVVQIHYEFIETGGRSLREILQWLPAGSAS